MKCGILCSMPVFASPDSPNVDAMQDQANKHGFIILGIDSHRPYNWHAAYAGTAATDDFYHTLVCVRESAHHAMTVAIMTGAGCAAMLSHGVRSANFVRSASVRFEVRAMVRVRLGGQRHGQGKGRGQSQDLSPELACRTMSRGAWHGRGRSQGIEVRVPDDGQAVTCQ